MQAVEMRLADISPDEVYLISYPRLPGRYEAMEGKFPGLPLLVVDQALRVACGHDLLLLLLRRGTAHAPVLQVDLSPAEILLLNYNVMNRLFGLNLYEKLLFIRKISPLCPAPEVRRRAELDFPVDSPLLRHLDGLLSEEFRFCLASGRLGLRTALKLAGMGKEDRLALLGVFASCRFSESQQRQVAQILEEVAFRVKKPIAAVLASGGLPGLLAGEMPQKKFLDALHGLRYPAWTRREKAWQAWSKRAARRGCVSLSHAPLFASEEVQLTFTVRNRAEAEKLLVKLKKSLEH